MRSFTEPNGFWLSSLARMRTSGFGESADTSTIGVWPMRSSTLSFTLAMVSMIRYAFPTRYPDMVDGFGQQSTACRRRRDAPTVWPESAQTTHDVLLGDRAVDDAVAAQRRRLVAQADDGVVPRRVGRLGDVGRARGGLGVGVAVDDADDLPAAVLGVALGPQVVAGVDRVHPGRRGGVAAGVEARHRSTRPPGRRAARTPRTGSSPSACATMSSTTSCGSSSTARTVASADGVPLPWPAP